MRLVIDASVAIKWLVEEEGSDAADRLSTDSNVLFAPRPMASEVADALWRKVRMGSIDRVEASAPMDAIPEMPVRWSADETVCAEAGRLAVSLDRPVYDWVYLALAHRLGVRLMTADARFANALASTGRGEIVTTLADHARERHR